MAVILQDAIYVLPQRPKGFMWLQYFLNATSVDDRLLGLHRESCVLKNQDAYAGLLKYRVVLL